MKKNQGFYTWIEGKVGDLFYLKRGKVILQNFIENNRGKFPVYSSQTENNGELGKINTYDFNGEFITWTTDGAHAGTIFYRNGKFSITDRCGIVEIKNLKLFDYFWTSKSLAMISKQYVNNSSANAKLMIHQLSDINFNFPCLKEQQKIGQLFYTLDKIVSLYERKINLFEKLENISCRICL
ncbi:hypothetical protein HF996_02900 [Mycoplasma sp. 1654_15]|nr:hypothetical protein HF996_02900 [Mycoplasma sp. 1654_15]